MAFQPPTNPRDLGPPSMARSSTVLLLILALSVPRAFGDGFSEAVTVRLVHPETQCERLIGLFEGTKAAHPAAAVAAWKHATGGSLGKSLEALITLANPKMVRELATFDGTRAAIGFDGGDGRVRWNLVVPHDDGTARAVATALVLTDGASEPPLDGFAVDRLGPPGAPLSAGSQGRFVVAGSRSDLAVALRTTVAAHADRQLAGESGLHVRIDPGAFPNTGPLTSRRIVEGFRGAGITNLECYAGLQDESLSLKLSGTLTELTPAAGTLEATWLDWVPAESTAVAVSLAADPRPEAWDRLFQVADRIEKLDPARAGVAPLRTRLNLIALAAKVNLEVDFLPALRGVTIAILADPMGETSGAIALIHATDKTAARRIETAVVPRLAATWVKGGEPGALPNGVRVLGRLSGRPVHVLGDESTVLIGWGEAALASAMEAKNRPHRSAGRTMRSGWSENAPQRAGAVWPGRLRIPASKDSPWPLALPGSAPILWHGTSDARTTHDEVRWPELHALVRSFLERIPLTPPPAS